MSVESVGSVAGKRPAVPGEAPEAPGFGAALHEVIREANADQLDAAARMRELLVEGRGTIHDAMVAMSKAEGSFRLLMEMRNRLVDAVNRLLTAQM